MYTTIVQYTAYDSDHAAIHTIQLFGWKYVQEYKFHSQHYIFSILQVYTSAMGKHDIKYLSKADGQSLKNLRSKTGT